MWIVYILLIYILVIHLIGRFVVPYLDFRRPKFETKIPNWLKKDIDRMNKKNVTDKKFLRTAYDYVTSRYYCSRFETITKFNYNFHSPFRHKKGHLPCTLMNEILRRILIYSGRFSDSEIQVKVVPFNMIVHQYLKVKINGKWMDIDPGGKSLGKEYGKHAAWFG